MKSARKPHRSFQFENLEPRQVMAAGIAASLNASGVLNIVGTDGDDQVLLWQIGKQISIAGVDGTWTASKVKSIVVDVHGGDDFICLDSVANGGTKKLNEKVTVLSGDGQEHVRLASSHDVYFKGMGHWLQVGPGAAPTLDGNALNLSTNVVASLRSGVLTVSGTHSADTIAFKQTNGKIFINGLSGSWSVAKVKSIVINLQDGNDYVSLDSLGNGGNQALKPPLTVNSGGGEESVHLANGHDVSFSGLGHELHVAADGTATLDGVVLTWDPQPDPEPDPEPVPPPNGNWFDAYIHDEALRSLGGSLYVDGLIDRSDIMALLESARDGSVVDSIEFNDLKAIATNTTLFGTLDHVWKLTTYVVSGSTANAKYQGQALGNLSAGSSDAHLGNLVNKWFLGLDRPTAGGTYLPFAGVLFVNGPSYSDVKQGSLGDCGTLASFAELAFRSPSAVENIFIINGDGTYTMRFYRSGIAEYLTVDSYLPTSSGSLVYASKGLSYTNTSGELWVALAEKGYAQFSEFISRANAYTSIVALWPNTPLGHITGQSTVVTTISGSTSLSSFANAYAAGKLICLTTLASGTTSGIVANHVYTVIGYDAATNTVMLFNPWGISYGLKTLTWSEVQANFTRFDRTA